MHLSDIDKRNLSSLVLAVIVTTTVSVLCAIWLLYQTAYDQHKQQQLLSIHHQKGLIEAVGRFDAINSQSDHKGGAIGGTLSQIIDAHRHSNEWADDSIFVLVEKNASSKIIFTSQKNNLSVSSLYQLGGEEIPMQQWVDRVITLSISHNGPIFTLNDDLIVSEIATIENKSFLLISKQSLAKIRAPFISAIAITLAVAIVLTLLSSIFIAMRVKPLLHKLESQTIYNQAILSTVINAMIVSDQQGKITIFNPAAEQMFGWKKEEIIGKSVNLIMPNAIAKQHDKFIDVFIKSRIPKMIGLNREIISQRKDGSTFPSKLALGHSTLPNGSNLFVAFITDITDEKKSQVELIEAKEAAETASKAKVNFMANMSHEIRTPMNAIIGFTELLSLDNSINEESQSHIATILSSSINLLEIINDILDFSKNEVGNFSLESICFNLSNAVDDSLKVLKLKAEDKGILLELSIASDVPTYILGDPIRLRQVILNLVGNAIKFTHQGFVKLKINRRQQNILEFTITDTGIGMNEQQQKIIFDPFSQADTSTSRRFGGTGLGTTISKQIVELMGGNITVKSEVDKGSSFHFTIRFQPAPSNTKGCLFEKKHLEVTMQASPRAFRVLIVEDIVANATLLKIRLSKQGHQVSWAMNGIEAVKAFQASEFDVILMDIQMPIMDGLQASKEIRKIERGKESNVPIIAQTASILATDIELCYAAGMNAICSKPINFSQLFEQLEKVVPEGIGFKTDKKNLEKEVTTDTDFTPIKALVDYPNGLQTWLDADAYVQALIDFCCERKNDAFKIKNLIVANPEDLAPAIAIAHSLKGLSGNLKIDDIANLATLIDSNLKSGKLKQATEIANKLEITINKVMAAISQLDVPRKVLASHEETLPFNAAAVKENLIQFILALDEFNPALCTPYIEQLSKYVDRKNLAPINRSIDRFDFAEAKLEARKLALYLAIELDEETI